jgi:hypothetical protein
VVVDESEGGKVQNDEIGSEGWKVFGVKGRRK